MNVITITFYIIHHYYIKIFLVYNIYLLAHFIFPKTWFFHLMSALSDADRWRIWYKKRLPKVGTASVPGLSPSIGSLFPPRKQCELNVLVSYGRWSTFTRTLSLSIKSVFSLPRFRKVISFSMKLSLLETISKLTGLIKTRLDYSALRF